MEGEDGVPVAASDDLSDRVKDLVASSSLKLPLVHSQYLHRCDARKMIANVQRRCGILVGFLPHITQNRFWFVY